MQPVEDHPATTAVHRKARPIQSTESSTTPAGTPRQPSARVTHNKRPVLVPVFYTSHLKDTTTQYLTVYLQPAFKLINKNSFMNEGRGLRGLHGSVQFILQLELHGAEYGI